MCRWLDGAILEGKSVNRSRIVAKRIEAMANALIRDLLLAAITFGRRLLSTLHTQEQLADEFL